MARKVLAAGLAVDKCYFFRVLRIFHCRELAIVPEVEGPTE